MLGVTEAEVIRQARKTAGGFDVSSGDFTSSWSVDTLTSYNGSIVL